MNTLQKTQNINSMDLTKFIMSMFVISIHTRPFDACANNSLLVINELMVRMAVPFFFLSAGYLLALKLGTPDQKEQNISVVSKYLWKILRMYLLWTIIYSPLAIYDYCVSDYTFVDAVDDYLRGLLLVGEHYNSWHLWYLLSTVYTLLLVLLFCYLKLNIKYMVIVGVIIGSVSMGNIGVEKLVLYDGTLSPLADLIRRTLICIISNGRVLQGFMYIPIGMYMAGKRLSILPCSIAFVACFAANYFISDSVISSYLLFGASVAVFGATLCINLKPRSIYQAARKLSTKMYLIHMYVWTFYYSVVYQQKTYGPDSFVITIILSVVIAFLWNICEEHKRTQRPQNGG